MVSNHFVCSQDSQADNGAGLENQFLIGSGVQIPVLAP